jgi:hypothetical protein
LELPEEKYYKHEFEKQLLMAMNLFRTNPNKFGSYIKQVKKVRPEFADDKKSVDRALLSLGDKRKMRPLTFHLDAN